MNHTRKICFIFKVLERFVMNDHHAVEEMNGFIQDMMAGDCEGVIPAHTLSALYKFVASQGPAAQERLESGLLGLPNMRVVAITLDTAQRVYEMRKSGRGGSGKTDFITEAVAEMEMAEVIGY